MKHLVTIPVTFLILLLSVKMSAQHNADSLAILSIIQEEVSSWNIGDADTYSKHFSENGTFTNIRDFLDIPTSKWPTVMLEHDARLR